MEHKYVVELQSPLNEPQLSRVAAEVAGALAISEARLTELLRRGTGRLTKPVDKPVAERVAGIARAAGADVEVVEKAPVPSAEASEFTSPSPADPTRSTVAESTVPGSSVPWLTLPESAVSELTGLKEVGQQEVGLKEAEATESSVVTGLVGKPSRRNSWLVPVVLLAVVALAVAVYGLFLR